jgi:chromosome segregation protein
LAEVARMRCEQLEEQSLRHQRRWEKLQLEEDDLKIADLDQKLQALRDKQKECLANWQQTQEQLTDLNSRYTELQAVQRGCVETLQETHGRLQTGHGRLASLQALQEAALGKHKETINAWLGIQGLDRAPRLVECLVVEPGWERAVETVLGAHLEGVCMENFALSVQSLATLQEGSLTLVHTAVDATPVTTTTADSLASKVQAPWPLHGLLGNARIAKDLEEALSRHNELTDQDSWVTPEGVWLGKNWLRIVRGNDDNSGVLEREREIKQLKGALEYDAQQEAHHTVTLEDVGSTLQELEEQRHQLHAVGNQNQREQAELQGRLTSLEERREQVLWRLQSIAEEREELTVARKQEQDLLRASRLGLEQALLAMTRLTDEREALTKERAVLGNALETARSKANTVRQYAQSQALTVESLRTRLSAARQGLVRMQTQYDQLLDRRQQLSLDLESSNDPLTETQQQLDERLHARVAAEAALKDAQQAVEAMNVTISEFDRSRAELEKQVQELRQVLEQQRLTKGEISVRQQGLQEQLQELHVSLPDLLPELDSGKTELHTQQALERLAQRIQRLGAVNLAAIDECTQVMERKGYLDTQHDDLIAALTTLENAMRKIDRETRARFKDTFERVNQGVQALFPRLFGGGEAYLAQTGDDLLETGVTVMARPPGKRISTIHLLSGGEKALTAVALVFAIFQLNPAPFCLLDEVDAPLDDANVGRFGDLLQEMAQHIQFIFITHNKSTMEIAHHLSGVTMHEPGVSRLVAVDVDAAVRLVVS